LEAVEIGVATPEKRFVRVGVVSETAVVGEEAEGVEIGGEAKEDGSGRGAAFAAEVCARDVEAKDFAMIDGGNDEDKAYRVHGDGG